MRAASIARKGAPVAAGASALALVLAAGALAAGHPRRAAPAHRHAAAASAPAPVVVDFGEFFYRPAVVHVKVGQQLVFRNMGKIAHTVADTDAKGRIRAVLIRPRNLDPGQRQTVIFARPGIVTYLCTFHPTLMRGRIVVTR